MPLCHNFPPTPTHPTHTTLACPQVGGMRWRVAYHLLDAVFYANKPSIGGGGGRMTVGFEDSRVASQVRHTAGLHWRGRGA